MKEPTAELLLQGEPIAMMRPRLGRGHTYNPQSREKKQVQREIGALWPGKPLETPLNISFVFGVSRDNRDIDNMCKFYLDAMQGIVFKNDLQVKILGACKVKKGKIEPFTLIGIEEMGRLEGK